MPRVRLGVAGIVFAAALAAPGSARAGIIDFIWEMSGPQMAGVPIECDIDVRTGEHECRLAEVHLSGEETFRRGQGRLWLVAGGGVYVATGKDSEMREFEFGKAQLFAVEPTLNFRSYEGPNRTVALEHGAGLSTFILHGKDFDTFGKLGIKTVPVLFRYKKFTIAYTLRLFPDGFTSQDFGVPTGAPNTHPGREVVHGFTIGVRWRPY